jgi:protein phosphatase
MKILLEAAAKTDVGVVRKNNEDNFGYDLNAGIFVVCDGMGGHAAGEMASRIAVSTVLKQFAGHEGNNEKVVGRPIAEVSARANRLASSILFANQAVRDGSSQNPAWAGMGSTIVAVQAGDGEFSVAHVGDSRAYLIREGTIHQLTSDHSLLAEQVRRGLMTSEEAEHSKLQNVIIRALGADEGVEPDLVDHQFQDGDVLLLCSDGLSRYVLETSLVEMCGTANLESACDGLIEAAKAGGSDDNITCLLLRATQHSWRDRLIGRLGTSGAHQAQTSWA